MGGKTRTGMRMGRTIAGERERAESSSERLLLREKEARKKRLAVGTLAAGLLLVAVLIAVAVKELAGKPEAESGAVEVYVPKVAIEDASGGGYATERMKEYVGRIERDFADLGYEVVRAVVPAGKTREIDVYLAGRGEYYKCSLDRGTAETAEDAGRMIEYLDEGEIGAKYVDVRLAGRAYYK